MADVATKLQIKPDQSIALIAVPEDVDLGVVADEADAATADAVVVFVTSKHELDDRAGPALDAARRDAVAWIAYPKGGQLGTDLNRDTLWQSLAGRGVRPVRQIAIDDVWSALRFRPA